MDVSFIKERSSAMEEGTWQEDLHGFPSVRIKVRSSNSPSVKVAIARAVREAADEFVDGELPREVAKRIDIEVFSSVGLLDWDGLTLGGKPFPFSVENAKDLLSGSWDFRDQVAIKMRMVGLSFQEKTEKISGN